MRNLELSGFMTDKKIWEKNHRRDLIIMRHESTYKRKLNNI